MATLATLLTKLKMQMVAPSLAPKCQREWQRLSRIERLSQKKKRKKGNSINQMEV